jgi:tripartite-type tricarboxylate transporter receptor subunit TctC
MAAPSPSETDAHDPQTAAAATPGTGRPGGHGAAPRGQGAVSNPANSGYPAKPIRWIVPYPAGAGADIVARTIGTQLAIDAGQPVLIENRAGGNTALGAIEAARAAADGYTLLSADNGMLVFNPALYRNLSYNPSRDFAPVTLLGRLPMVMLVGPSSGQKDARAFIDDARAFPGKVSFASAGTGSPQHLAMELLEREAGLEMVHVPYRGAAPALADVAGGQLPVMMCDLAASRRFIQSGKLRALAVAHPQRLKELPWRAHFRRARHAARGGGRAHGPGGAGQHARRAGLAAAAVGGRRHSQPGRAAQAGRVRRGARGRRAQPVRGAAAGRVGAVAPADS